MLLHTAPLQRLIPARVIAPAGVVRCVYTLYGFKPVEV
jgi:hypothetical protein